MNDDPRTRLVDAAELREQLAQLALDLPTTLYARRPPPKAEAPSPPARVEHAIADDPRADTQAAVSRRLLRGAHRSVADPGGDVAAGASHALPAAQGARAAWRVGWFAKTARHLRRRTTLLGARPVQVVAAAVAFGSAVFWLVLRPTVASRDTAAAEPPRDAEASPPREPAPEIAHAPLAAAPATSVRDAAQALAAGRRRDALTAYRALPPSPAFEALVRILEAEEQRAAARAEEPCCGR